MKTILALAVLLGLTVSAQAHTRHHHRYHHKHHYAHAHHHYRHRVAHRYQHNDFPSHLVTVKTAAGIAITVAQRVAERFEGFIAGLVALGYHPHHIGCFAAHGHVPHSRHHVGEACDFDQIGWNKVTSNAKLMYSEKVTHLAHKYGFVSGCEFHSRKDCGHIGTDMTVAYAESRHRTRYASR